MKKLFFALILMIIPWLMPAQDVILDPIEMMPKTPSAYSLAQGNWGLHWFGTEQDYEEATNRATGKVLYVIFDTSPRWDHPFLQKVAWNEKGKSYTGEPEIIDGNGHGHHVMGIIGASNEAGNIGVAQGLVDKGLAKGIPREVLSDRGSGSFSVIARAIRDMNQEVPGLQSQGWHIIYNFSLGGPGTNTAISEALQEAKDLGVLVFASSGNTYEEGIRHPANSEAVNAIGSIDSDGEKSAFSTWGDGLYMTGPGAQIYSTYLNGTQVELSGTSMASPMVAAYAGWAWSLYPELSNVQLEEMLKSVTRDLGEPGYDLQYGYGSPQLRQILDWFEDPGPPDPPQDPEQDLARRSVTVTLPGYYDALYQTGGGYFSEITVTDISLMVRSDKAVSDIVSSLTDQVELFFTNRGMTIRDNEGEQRAGHWAGKFLEIFFKEEFGRKVKVKDLQVFNGGARVSTRSPGLFDFFSPSKRQTFTY